MLVRVVMVQHRVGDPIDLDLRLHLFRKRPDIICFPEYWGAGAGVAGQVDLAREAGRQEAEMARLSQDLDCLVLGGTVVLRDKAGYHNTCPVYRSGRRLGEYRKNFPTQREKQKGIIPGISFDVWGLDGIRVGVAICADCFHELTFDRARRRQVDILFVPNASPLREGEPAEAKFRRDQDIFVAGAARAGAYVVKVCGVGTLFDGRLQGRSLVAAPWGIMYRVPPEEEDRAQVITVNLPCEELRDFRRRFPVARAPFVTPATDPLAAGAGNGLSASETSLRSARTG